MAASVIVDAGFLVALLVRADSNHRWAEAQAKLYQPPWRTCEAALSEAFHLLGYSKAAALNALIQRNALTISFRLGEHMDSVLKLMDKYSDVPMSLADASLVRMTRSEEHTSELQSQFHLVCRLLLEKKKKIYSPQ